LRTFAEVSVYMRPFSEANDMASSFLMTRFEAKSDLLPTSVMQMLELANCRVSSSQRPKEIIRG
jgi:hypothetical protein